MQRHRDKVAHLMDTLRSIIPPTEKHDRLSVLEMTIKHINRLTGENEVCACHEGLLQLQITQLHSSNYKSFRNTAVFKA